MDTLIRPVISRFISSIVAAIAAYGFLHWKVNVDTATQKQLVEAVVAFVLPFFGIIYAILHKVIDKWVNPADAAAKPAIVEGRLAARRIR